MSSWSGLGSRRRVELRSTMAGGGGGGGGSTLPAPPKSVVVLREWWLVKQRKGLAVGGVASDEKDRERVFLSSVIAEREEVNVLHTQDGITIICRGFINTSRSSQNGVPSEVSQHFLVGFPHDWNKYSPRSFADSTASSIDNMECESNNSEKGISVESQASHASGQPFIGMCDCTRPSGKNIFETPTSTNKRKAIRQKIVLDANNSVSRMVTRSISKNSHTMLKEDKKAPIAGVISPFRRSPRLKNCK